MARLSLSFGGGIFAVSVALAACSSSSDSSDSTNQGTDASDSGADSQSEGDAKVPGTDAAPSTDGGSSVFAPIELDLIGCPQAGYVAPFSIGGSSFGLTVDTGSSDIGVVASTCDTCGGITPTYTPGSSATDQDQTATISYSSGANWAGDIYSDTFGPNSALAPQTKVVAIDSQTKFFETDSCQFGAVQIPYEGIAGFGVASSASSGVDAPMTALTGAGMPNIFSLALCGLGGKMWLGGFDPASASAAPLYTPLLSGFYYNIKVDDLSVGATAMGLNASAIGEVDIDSDTTELELPQSVYNAVKAAIGNNPAFVQHFGGTSFFANGDCIKPLDETPPTQDALDAALPTLTFMLDDGAGGTKALTLKATSSYLQPEPDGGDYDYCPEMEPSGTSKTIIGSSIVREQVVIYDIASSRIGFAPYAGCTTR